MTDWGELSGPEKKIVRDAILAGFTQQSLDMALVEANKSPLHVLVAPSAFDFEIFQLIQKTQAEGWTAELIALLYERSKHPRMQALYTLAAFKTPGEQQTVANAFQKAVRPGEPLPDMGLWGVRYDAIQRQVCRIEIPSLNPALSPDPVGIGTGFLVAADLVLTNHHVVVASMEGPHDAFLAPEAINCRFDFANDTTGRVAGTAVALAAAWLVAWAPRSAFDPGDNGGSPAAGDLDFALIRLASPVGNQPAPGVAKRGWVKSSKPPVVKPKDILFIAQHPMGDPIKLGIGATLGVNAGATRVTYDANTERGSSGSPVFNAALDLVALHHSGDPNFKVAEYNQGIIIEKLIHHLDGLPTVPKFWQT